MKIASFRDISQPPPTLLSTAKNFLGKFFSRLIWKNGGTNTEDVPAPDENLQTVDEELEKIKMPIVEVVDQRI